MKKPTRTCATRTQKHEHSYSCPYNIYSYHITLGRMGSAPSSLSLSLEPTGSTPSLESPSRDSISTIFAFFEVLLSLVDMVQGFNDSRCRGPGCVCCAGQSSQPHTTSSTAAAVCAIPTYVRVHSTQSTYVHMCTKYHMLMIPGIQLRTQEASLAFLSQI